jgi:heme A synthase
MSTYPSYSNLGEVVEANQTIDSALDPRRVRNIIMLLAASVALMMTGSTTNSPGPPSNSGSWSAYTGWQWWAARQDSVS